MMCHTPYLTRKTFSKIDTYPSLKCYFRPFDSVENNILNSRGRWWTVTVGTKCPNIFRFIHCTAEVVCLTLYSDVKFTNRMLCVMVKFHAMLINFKIIIHGFRCAVLTETCHRFLDLTGPLQIGGLPSLPVSTTFQISSKDFVGCIADVHIDHRLLDLNRYAIDTICLI